MFLWYLRIFQNEAVQTPLYFYERGARFKKFWEPTLKAYNH